MDLSLLLMPQHFQDSPISLVLMLSLEALGGMLINRLKRSTSGTSFSRDHRSYTHLGLNYCEIVMRYSKLKTLQYALLQANSDISSFEMASLASCDSRSVILSVRPTTVNSTFLFCSPQPSHTPEGTFDEWLS